MVASSTQSSARMSGHRAGKGRMSFPCVCPAPFPKSLTDALQQDGAGSLVPPLPRALPGTRLRPAPHTPLTDTHKHIDARKRRTKHILSIRSRPWCCPKLRPPRTWPVRLRFCGIKASPCSLTLWRSAWSFHGGPGRRHLSWRSPGHLASTPSLAPLFWRSGARWVPPTNQLGSAIFTDFAAPLASRRFYRARSVL